MNVLGKVIFQKQSEKFNRKIYIQIFECIIYKLNKVTEIPTLQSLVF